MIRDEQLENMAEEILAGRADATTHFLFKQEFRHRTAPPNRLEAERVKARPKPPALIRQAAIRLGIEKGAE